MKTLIHGQHMQYDLNQLADPKRFQRLVNAILTARFGEDARLTPIHGTDGGSDGETATANPYMEFRYKATSALPSNPLVQAPRPGRYLFQAKYHRTGDQRLSDLRSNVVSEFRAALNDEVIRRSNPEEVNYFFLVTNVTASKESLKKVDRVRLEVLKGRQHLHADVWWGERVTAALDWAPELWQIYPELFPGSIPPLLGAATTQHPKGFARTLKLAIGQQYERDSKVKFRQIELEQRLLDLFVDLDIGAILDIDETTNIPHRRFFLQSTGDFITSDVNRYRAQKFPESVLQLLLDDTRAIPRILLEGGPGQGKSTITQMAAQIYREKFLDTQYSDSRDPSWHRLCQLRVPIRIELRSLARWMGNNTGGSLEQYIVQTISRDSGGVIVKPEDFHQFLDHSSAILFLDGLDEIGNDTHRDQVLDVAFDAVGRFENGLHANVRVVLTTRPPAVVGRWNKLEGFIRILLAPMESQRIGDYLSRWINVHIPTDDEKERINTSFNSRRHDPHVEALARNPMQLSVLLQFIHLKGEAFPDRRAELYREYFLIVIDRDVEKSPELREHRDIVEGLHSYLGFLLHGYAEIEKGRRSLNRGEIVQLAGDWLEGEGRDRDLAGKYFALGEERFGLIVALSGEGQETTYGFEVQPIQEYFAAAYISNRLPNGTAHDVFEKLIYRDYWREVALFLAGLRRHNEKADLLGRAKQADAMSIGLGPQNGRLIILQLLREGVLKDPHHVQTESMRYVMGFLDAGTLRLHRNNRELIDILSELVCMFGGDETRATIAKHLDGVSKSNDRTLVSLMHRIGRRSLPKEQYRELVLDYKGVEVEARSMVRINQPFIDTNLIEELACHRGYWDSIPPHVIARRLWMSATHYNVVPEVVYPSGAHLHLLVQFATGQSSVRARRGGVVTIRGTMVPAVWKLYRNVQLIRHWPVGEDECEAYCDEHFSGSTTKKLLWMNGKNNPLPRKIQKCVRDLVYGSEKVVSTLRSKGRKDTDKSYVAYLALIRKYIEEPGIVGWIGARCAIELFRSTPDIRNASNASGIFDEIVETLQELYFISDVHHLARMHYFEHYGYGMPLAIRLEPDAAWRPLYEVAADLALGKNRRELECHSHWLTEAPLPRAIIRPLIEACRGEMAKVLRFIGSRMMATGPLYYSERLLKVQDTHRVLKICRETDDTLILRGAAQVLVNATFARLGEPEVIQKIAAAAPDSLFVVRLFNTRDRMRKQKDDKALRELARTVARRIVDEADVHAFRVVNRAAVFLSEVEVRRNVPLFEECPELGKQYTHD